MGVTAVPSGEYNIVQSNSYYPCVDDILAPLRSKMKVLKKIKKRIGLSPRSCNGVNNLPPILFHQVHGDNVRISQNGAVARRVESFCRGVTFTNRPIKVQEKVCVKFLEVSNNWSGVVRFGFTSTDPNTLRYSLPKYACPDLTNKPGYWAKALAERFAEQDTVLFYYVTAAGDVHFGINGEEKGIFFSGVDTRGPIWGLFDIYGNSTGIELVSPRTHLNNLRQTPIVEEVLPAFQSLCVSAEEPIVRQHQQCSNLVPLPFHRTRGHNIRLSNDRCVASRCDTEFCHGYVFTARPVCLEEKIVVEVLATESMYVGALAFGLTSCDPTKLSSNELPEDADALLDRPEYWVVNKDVASIPQRGDELVFSVSATGQVSMAKNGSAPLVFMHVDHTLKLWAFFDVYGSTQRIRIAGVVPPPPRPEPVNRVRPAPRECFIPSSTPSPSPISAPRAEVLQLEQTMGGGTVLVVNLPPAQPMLQHQQARWHDSPVPPSAINHLSHQQISRSHSNTPKTPDYSDLEPTASGSYSTINSVTPWLGSECTVCYERAVDSVLYVCGHMCMCYDCAVQQWRGKGGGHCPLCRAVIRDVIRTYKS